MRGRWSLLGAASEGCHGNSWVGDATTLARRGCRTLQRPENGRFTAHLGNPHAGRTRRFVAQGSSCVSAHPTFREPSFIGFAPARNPRLLVSVMVDEPRGDIYGGTVAAPAFERIMEFALPYLKIPPE